MSLAFFMSACGDDNSSGASVDCLDNENCLEEPGSSDSDNAESSSSVKAKSSSSSKAKSSSSGKVTSSSSKKDEKSSSSEKKDSSSSAKSSSSDKDNKSSSSEAKSSSSEKKDDSSSSVTPQSSSSSASVSSSSEEPESSSSSVELKITYLSETPNAVDLEVSGDTLFAVFQRSVPGDVVGFPEPGLLAIYKLSDGTLLDTITLATKNPQAVKMVKGSLYVGTTGGSYNASWGTDADEERGIEKVDLKNKKSELWVSGTQLGAGVYMMEADPKKGKIYVVINKGYDADFNASMPVMEVDVATKAVKSVGDVTDGSGSLFVDATGKLYIGDRGFLSWTGDMGKMNVRVYDGSNLTALFQDLDPETYEGFMYQPAGISVIDGEVFVYISDYKSGKLYWVEDDDICDGDDAIQFSGDTKIVTVDGKLYVLDRKGSGSISKVNTSAKTVAWQKAIDAENPYDIVAIDNSTAWVAMYNTAEIRKISLADGSTVSSIDTKEFSAKKIEAAE